jgi:ribosomal protein S1
MTDEMVQETTETTATTGANGTHAPETAPVENVSTEVTAAPAVTEEPTPTQPVASMEATETPAPAAPSDTDAFTQEMQRLQEMESEYEQTFSQLEADKVVWGTVMRIDREGVLVDVGAKSEGIIRLNELSKEAGVIPEEVVQVGDRIKVYVLEAENRDGIPVLSKKRADFEQAWEHVEQARVSGEVIMAMVTDRVKGGLVVDLGVRGFVPASHVGTGSLKTNLDRYVGQSIPLKVIEVDRKARKVVLSNKLAVQEEREARSAETKASLTVNTIRRGQVRRLTSYGAFIDLGGIDGLLHISEMSWTRINDPKEVLKEGQELDVLILKLDLENNRVSLGLRQILPDPWTEIPSRYKEGDIVHGTVTRLVPFGAFVKLDNEEIEGIIPNNELPRVRGGKGPGINEKDEVEAKILSIKPDERKMTLSMRVLQPVEEQPAPVRESGVPSAGSVPSGSGGGKRREKEREREDRGDYTRYMRNEEPRFTIGDAFAAARKERSRRERRTQEEDEFDYEDITEDITLEEEMVGEEETDSTKK